MTALFPATIRLLDYVKNNYFRDFDVELLRKELDESKKCNEDFSNCPRDKSIYEAVEGYVAWYGDKKYVTPTEELAVTSGHVSSMMRLLRNNHFLNTIKSEHRHVWQKFIRKVAEGSNGDLKSWLFNCIEDSYYVGNPFEIDADVFQSLFREKSDFDNDSPEALIRGINFPIFQFSRMQWNQLKEFIANSVVDYATQNKQLPRIDSLVIDRYLFSFEKYEGSNSSFRIFLSSHKLCDYQPKKDGDFKKMLKDILSINRALDDQLNAHIPFYLDLFYDADTDRFSSEDDIDSFWHIDDEMKAR
jgi:hypothetical protein